ncbi:MAG TPA: ABC transporter permease [Vicinamibacterales bacterium]|nr:ABC transporter permease [Vicinamibacterales bacterium]
MPDAGAIVRDVRYGARLLARTPVFASVVILSLALGIGANAAIFQLIDSLRLRSLPIANPQELAEVRAEGVHAFGVSQDFNAEVTYPLWEEIRARQTAFARIFAWGNTTFLVGQGADIHRARGLWVSGDFFPTLGIVPERGRLLTTDDDRRGCGAGPAVISHGFWQTYFGGRDSAIGSTLTISEQPITVVGVTPARFTGLEVGQTFDIALPTCAAAVRARFLDQRDFWWLTVMGRLRPEWTIAHANEQMRVLSPGLLAATIPAGYGTDLIEKYRALRFGVIPAGRGVSRLREAHGLSLSLLLALTGLVLLITCGNVATLMLARAGGRQREIAVRVAIGASRVRLVSQMLVEGLLVAAGGALLAIPVALWSSAALVAFLATSANPISLNLAADWRLISFVGVVAVVTSIVFGLVPALRVSIVDPAAAMHRASRTRTVDRRRTRLQSALVSGQIAISFGLVVAALLFVRSFRNLTSVDTGFERNGTVAVWFTDPAANDRSVEEHVALQQRLTAEIGAVPGVGAAAATTHLPVQGGTWFHFFRLPGEGGNRQYAARFAYVSPGYFDTLKIPIRSGRNFLDSDNAKSRRVLLVNQSFVREYLRGVEPIGSTIRTIAEAGYPEATYEIIGSVGDTKYASLQEEMPSIAYVPIAQDPDVRQGYLMIVRSNLPSAVLERSIAQRVNAVNPRIAVQFTRIKDLIDERLVLEHAMAWLAGAFGALAIAIVAIGVYGIIAYLVVSRRNEIAIRVSLGATRQQILRLVLRDTVGPLAAGVFAGIPLAVATTQMARAMLFGLSPGDLPTMAGAVGLLIGTGGLAASLPAWRATRVDPNVVLRAE